MPFFPDMARFRLSVEFDDSVHPLFSMLATLQGMGLVPKVEELGGNASSIQVTQQPSPPPKKAAGVADPWAALMKLCNENQLRVLELVKGAPAGITSHEMAKTMGVAVTKINGYINGGLLRNLPKAGLDIDDVLVVSKSGTTTYRPGKLLVSEAVAKGGATVG